MQNATELNTETTTFLRPVLRDDLFTAYRPLDFKTRAFIPVTIKRSISILYKKSVYDHAEHYMPVTYKDTVILDAIHELFSGSPTPTTMSTLFEVHVRSGWMDKSLSNLTFGSIIDLYNKFVDDKLDRKSNQKLRQVLAALTMSKRDMVKCYSLPDPSKMFWETPFVYLDEDFKVKNTKNHFTVVGPSSLETQNANPI